MADQIALLFIKHGAGLPRGHGDDANDAVLSLDEVAATSVLQEILRLCGERRLNCNDPHERGLACAVLDALGQPIRVRLTAAADAAPRLLASFASAEIAAILFSWFQRDAALLAKALTIASAMKRPGIWADVDANQWDVLTCALQFSHFDCELLSALDGWVSRVLEWRSYDGGKQMALSTLPTRAGLLRCIECCRNVGSTTAACRILRRIASFISPDLAAQAVRALCGALHDWTGRALSGSFSEPAAAACVTTLMVLRKTCSHSDDARHHMFSSFLAVLARLVGNGDPGAPKPQSKTAGATLRSFFRVHIEPHAGCAASTEPVASDASAAAPRRAAASIPAPPTSSLRPVVSRIATSIANALRQLPVRLHYGRSIDPDLMTAPESLALLVVRGNSTAAVEACKTLSHLFSRHFCTPGALSSRVSSLLVNRLAQRLCEPGIEGVSAESLSAVLTSLLSESQHLRAQLATPAALAAPPAVVTPAGPAAPLALAALAALAGPLVPMTPGAADAAAAQQTPGALALQAMARIVDSFSLDSSVHEAAAPESASSVSLDDALLRSAMQNACTILKACVLLALALTETNAFATPGAATRPGSATFDDGAAATSNAGIRMLRVALKAARFHSKLFHAQFGSEIGASLLIADLWHAVSSIASDSAAAAAAVVKDCVDDGRELLQRLTTSLTNIRCQKQPDT